jgi:hypothetical protein
MVVTAMQASIFASRKITTYFHLSSSSASTLLKYKD